MQKYKIQYETAIGDSTTFSIRCYDTNVSDGEFIEKIHPLAKKYIRKGDTFDYDTFVSGERVAMFFLHRRVLIDEIKLSDNQKLNLQRWVDG